MPIMTCIGPVAGTPRTHLTKGSDCPIHTGNHSATFFGPIPSDGTLLMAAEVRNRGATAENFYLSQEINYSQCVANTPLFSFQGVPLLSEFQSPCSNILTPENTVSVSPTSLSV